MNVDEPSRAGITSKKGAVSWVEERGCACVKKDCVVWRQRAFGGLARSGTETAGESRRKS